jgi:hypothetical protein
MVLAARRTGEQSVQAGQQGTVGRLVGGTPHLSAKYFHFVAQGEVLDCIGLFASEKQEDQGE